MINLKSIFITFVVAVSFTTNMQAQTPNTEWYDKDPNATTFYIGTADELAGLATLVNGKNKVSIGDFGDNYHPKKIILTADIDLSAYGETWNDGDGWIPIGHSNATPFRGDFDGNRHKITGLYINATRYSSVKLEYNILIGLFGINKGIVQNLGLEEVNIAGEDQVGGIAGYTCGNLGGSNASIGKIKNCYVTGSITAKGYEYPTKITKGVVGGIVGDTYGSATIENCYSTAAIKNTLTSASSPITSVGGLVGMFNNYANVINSVALNTSIETGTSKKPGRIVGDDNKRIVTNSYAASEMVISNPNDIGITLPTAQILTVDFWTITVGWDDDIWFFENGVLPVFSTTHTVSFAGEDIDIDSQDVKKGNPVKQPKTPEREGYDFGGWFTDNSAFLNEWNFQTDAIMQDTTLYGKWSIKTYLVTFAGEAINGIATQSIEHGRRATQPGTPRREGYNFEGWFTDNGTFLNKWNFQTDAVMQNTTLYAKWSIKTYRVTFAGEAINDIATQSVEHGRLATQPSPPKREGYNFGGWFSDNGTFLNKWNFQTDVVMKNTTLYAKWEKITGIADIENAGIEIYPNPVKDVLRIENSELRIKRVEIIDLFGKVIYQFNNLRNQINVSALSQGIYFVKLETDKGIVTKKFVKE
jgi:uncharacterized repeat protein (TIGR02543 family)